MRSFSVRQLSDISGVSVRTLHHYDEIGLLKPYSRSEAGYRKYGQEGVCNSMLSRMLLYIHHQLSGCTGAS